MKTPAAMDRQDAPLNGEAGDSRAQKFAQFAFLAVAIIASMLILWWASGSVLLLAGLVAGTILAAALIHFAANLGEAEEEASAIPPDWAVTRLAADQADMALAICDRAGRLVCANERFTSWFPGLKAPPGIAIDEVSQHGLAEATRIAWRDGKAVVQVASGAARYAVRATRGGTGEKYLVWSFQPVRLADLAEDARQHLSGPLGRALSRAQVAAVAIEGDGRIASANSAFAERATGDANGGLTGQDLADFLSADEDGNFYFAREGARALPVRLIHVPLDPPSGDRAEDSADAPSLFYIVDEERAGGHANMRAIVENLVANLPVGLALVDRDGRFLYANEGFARIAGVEGDMPRYPGDIVVKEDKGALSDTIRRFANGSQLSGDIAVRLKGTPDDVVSLSVGGLRGVGDAAVLLSLADTREESELKSQMAQVTKMQAVGQLAGGVAHDFNNILTAILGLCDLMLLRHSPGDSDYDDVQQIKNNANRAANLTRQLLAFSRQQTLRPQVVQLADIVVETSQMLKRIIKEKVSLELSHGRGVGAVRADPGQLGQVIMNLAVNANDAMPDGGKLHIETGAVTSADVRKMEREVMPIADYARLSVWDQGEGIDPAILPKIFDPFFTTKPLGKGTGLGLSTVYGIVKQSGGFIFADNQPGGGARFDIFFPIHRGGQAVEGAQPKAEAPAGETWGSGRILLVEDEHMVRAVGERALVRQGYTVETAEDGEAAVELLKQGRDYDLIVSDVVMPNMDGPAMARLAREMRPDIKILFMSGYAEEQLRKTIDIDNVGFLPKPFTVPQIGRAVAQMLGQ